MATTEASQREPTFTSYNATQAKLYNQYRSGYPEKLIQYIVAHHEKTYGNLGTVLDVGCGPGNSTRDLAPYFANAIGIDPSEAMTAAGREAGGKTKAGNPISYVTSDAEECEGVPDGSIDLLTAAMSAYVKPMSIRVIECLRHLLTLPFFDLGTGLTCLDSGRLLLAF
jgi:trans-aconitate 3-methyltransferase